MSHEDEEPLPPKRPRPRPLQTTLAEGQETFQPASSRPAGGTSKSKTRRTIDEPRPVIGGPTWIERLVFGKVSSGHLSTFCGQFARYQEAGVDLLRSLASLQKQFSTTALGPVIGRIEVAVRGGESLASAMAREPQAFDKLCLSMMRVAEARGGEPETLKGLSRHYEAKQRMIRQARSAMIYPTIVLLVASVVVMLLTIFVIPKMVEFIADGLRGKSVELPFPTRVLMAISGFMTAQGWWLVPLASVGGVFGLLWWYRTAAGKLVLDGLSLYVPVLGKIRKKIETTRFARTLAALLNAGVDVVDVVLVLTSEVRCDPSAPYKRADRRGQVGGHGRHRAERGPRRDPPLLDRRHRDGQLGRGDRQAPRDPRQDRRRLRGAGRIYGQEPREPDPAGADGRPRRGRPVHRPRGHPQAYLQMLTSAM